MSLAFPHGEIEVTYFSTILLVEVSVGHVHDALQRLVIPEEADFF